VWAQYVWIAANVVNVLALGASARVFWRRRVVALARLHPEDRDAPQSVKDQRALNASTATAEVVKTATLATIGVGMISAALLWPRFTATPVPWFIPIFTSLFAVPFLGEAAWRYTEAIRRAAIVTLALVEFHQAQEAATLRQDTDPLLTEVRSLAGQLAVVVERLAEITVLTKHAGEQATAAFVEANGAKEALARAVKLGNLQAEERAGTRGAVQADAARKGE
jgi:hypothetical protein